MKRICKSLWVLLLVLSLWACGVEKPPETTPTTTASTTEPTTESTTEPTTEPTTAPTTEPATEPTTEPPTEPPTEPAEITYYDSQRYCDVPEEYYLFLFRTEEDWYLPDTDTSQCEDMKMYIYDESQDALWQVVDEQVMGRGGIWNTRDHIYYVPESDHTKVYRVEYSGENKTLLYESEYGEIGWMDYFGIDPNGVLYLLTGGNRVIALDIATGNVETVMEQYEIISFMYYPDYVRDGGEHLGPTFDWIGKPSSNDKASSWLYCIETGENIHYPRC